MSAPSPEGVNPFDRDDVNKALLTPPFCTAEEDILKRGFTRWQWNRFLVKKKVSSSEFRTADGIVQTDSFSWLPKNQQVQDDKMALWKRFGYGARYELSEIWRDKPSRYIALGLVSAAVGLPSIIIPISHLTGKHGGSNHEQAPVITTEQLAIRSVLGDGNLLKRFGYCKYDLQQEAQGATRDAQYYRDAANLSQVPDTPCIGMVPDEPRIVSTQIELNSGDFVTLYARNITPDIYTPTVPQAH